MNIISLNIENFRSLIDESEDKFVHTKEGKESKGGATLSLLESMKRTFLDLAINFVIKDGGGNQCGYVSVWPLKETLAIGPLYVSEMYRGRGLAKLLVLHVISYARENGYKGVRTQTWSSNTPTTKLFPSLGFKVRKTIPDDRVDGSDTIQYILNFN